MPGEAKPFTRFVGAVDEVNDHFGSILLQSRKSPRSKRCRLVLNKKRKEFVEKGADIYAKP